VDTFDDPSETFRPHKIKIFHNKTGSMTGLVANPVYSHAVYTTSTGALGGIELETEKDIEEINRCFSFWSFFLFGSFPPPLFLVPLTSADGRR